MGIQKYVNKLLISYLDIRLVFFCDLFLTTVASAFTILMLYAVSGGVHFQNNEIWIWLGLSVFFSGTVMLLSKSYKVIIRHSTWRDITKLSLQLLLKEIFMGAVLLSLFGMSRAWLLCLLCDYILGLFLLVIFRASMITVYDIIRSRRTGNGRKRVLVVGNQDKVAALVVRFKNSSHIQIVGALSNDKGKSNLSFNEVPLFTYSDEKDIVAIVGRQQVEAILFASERDAKKENDGLIKICVRNNINTLITPDLDEVKDGKLLHSKIREIRIEDLLGRDEITISLNEIKESLKGKVVMVTGAAGSIGSELCRQISVMGIKKLILFDNAETPMHNLRLELDENFPELDFTPVIGDVRQVPRLDYVFRKHRPQIVFHAAAYKHVPLMEDNPCEAVRVNVIGSRDIADKCIEYDVEKMVLISTDKAVNPTNIMGCTKRLAEIYVQSLGLALSSGEINGRTKFVTTRFGNVLGSNGSVIPRFRSQIECGGPVTVTDPRIIRFFMTIPEACRLVMEAATLSKGNQIFVFDMGEPVKIDTLARNMIQLAGFVPDKDIKVVYTGLRPGEKLFEEVLASEENTEPTSHERIRIAKVREYEYRQVDEAFNNLDELSRNVNIPEMVILMKQIVPEFKSKNSVFEIYD